VQQAVHYYLALAASSSFFDSPSTFGKREIIGGIISYTAGQVVSGMIGYGLMYAAGASEIPFGAVVADMAVGAPVTAIPLTLGLACCIGITMCCGVGIGAGVGAGVGIASAVKDGGKIEKALKDIAIQVTTEMNTADQSNTDKSTEETEEEYATGETDDKQQESDSIPTIVIMAAPAAPEIVLPDAAVQQVFDVVVPTGQEDVAEPFFAIDINDGADNNEETAESAIKPSRLKM
jgi:hypothetical protein